MRAHWLLAIAASTALFGACSASNSADDSSGSPVGSARDGGTSTTGTQSDAGGGTGTTAGDGGTTGTGTTGTGIPGTGTTGTGTTGTGTTGTGTGGTTKSDAGTGGTGTGTGTTTDGGGGTTGGSSDAGDGGGGGGGVLTGNGDGGPASAATTTVIGNGCTPPSQYANLFITLGGQTQASTDAKLAGVWNQLFNPSNANTIFYDGPGTGEAYVEDIADNDVRTEGQSYGMMISVQLNHQTEFDELWAFAKHYMYQTSNKQYAWHVSTAGKNLGATGGAPDGDEYFAAALVFAHYRWGDTSGKYDYGTEAQAVLDLVRTQDFDQSNHIVQYFEGAGDTQNGTDGSYMLPAFYQTWACFDTANAAFWTAAVTSTRSFFHTITASNGVIPDQSSFAGAATNSSGDDKLRCVANIMSDHNFFDADTWQTMTYAPEYGTHEASGTTSTAELACDGLLGFGLPAAQGTPFVTKLWSAAIPTGNFRYYDGALYTLALLHVSGAFQLWY